MVPGRAGEDHRLTRSAASAGVNGAPTERASAVSPAGGAGRRT